MPARDGTGPRGQGPMTGRQRGPCQTAQTQPHTPATGMGRRCGNGRGRNNGGGFGNGWGRGNGFGGNGFGGGGFGGGGFGRNVNNTPQPPPTPTE